MKDKSNKKSMNRKEKFNTLFLIIGCIGIIYSLIMMNNDPIRYLSSEIVIGVGIIILIIAYKKEQHSTHSKQKEKSEN